MVHIQSSNKENYLIKIIKNEDNKENTESKDDYCFHHSQSYIHILTLNISKRYLRDFVI